MSAVYRKRITVLQIQFPRRPANFFLLKATGKFYPKCEKYGKCIEHFYGNYEKYKAKILLKYSRTISGKLIFPKKLAVCWGLRQIAICAIGGEVQNVQIGSADAWKKLWRLNWWMCWLKYTADLYKPTHKLR